MVKEFGEIVSCNLGKNKYTGKPLGYDFIQFCNSIELF